MAWRKSDNVLRTFRVGQEGPDGQDLVGGSLGQEADQGPRLRNKHRKKCRRNSAGEQTNILFLFILASLSKCFSWVIRNLKNLCFISILNTVGWLKYPIIFFFHSSRKSRWHFELPATCCWESSGSILGKQNIFSQTATRPSSKSKWHSGIIGY